MAQQQALKQEQTLVFERKRVHAILAALEAAASGEYTRLPLSAAEDELDAIAHAVNVLLDERRLGGREGQAAPELASEEQ